MSIFACPCLELRPVSDPAVARGGSHSDEAKRRGSHRLAECVEKMQFSPAAENADVAYVPPSGVATDSRRMPAEIMQERGESWSGIVTGSVLCCICNDIILIDVPIRWTSARFCSYG